MYAGACTGGLVLVRTLQRLRPQQTPSHGVTGKPTLIFVLIITPLTLSRTLTYSL